MYDYLATQRFLWRFFFSPEAEQYIQCTVRNPGDC